MKRYENCPACGGAVGEGSHWDCIFDLLADWVDASAARRKEDQAATGEKKVEGENG